MVFTRWNTKSKQGDGGGERGSHKKSAWWQRVPVKKIALATLGVLIVCGLASGVYLLLFSPQFVIDFVDVKNDEGVDATGVRSLVFQQMEGRRALVLPQRNLLFFNEESARKTIWDTYALDKLVIEKHFPRTLVITITGTPFAVAWLGQGDKWYHLDAKGRMAREVDPKLLSPVAARLAVSDAFASLLDKPSDIKGVKLVKGAPLERSKESKSDTVKNGASIPLVMDIDRGPVTDGEQVIDQKKASCISRAPAVLSGIGLTPLYFKTTRSNVDVIAVTTEGWEVLLNSYGDLDEQVKNLDIVLRTKVKDDRKKLKYVDVRFDNRIFFKL